MARRRKKTSPAPIAPARAEESDWQRALADPLAVRTLRLDVRQLPAVRFPAARRLPADIGRFAELRELSIRARNLGWLCPELGQLPHLETLRIDNAESVLELGETLRALPSLRTLGLYNVGLVGPVPLPPTLERLSLEANPQLDLRAWARTLQANARLVALDIGGSVSGELTPELGLLGSLCELSVTQCGLTRVPDAVLSLRGLRTLNLAVNRLTELDPRLLDLSDLQVLQLAGNPLREFPSWLARLKSLRLLYIDELSADVLESLRGLLPACRIEVANQKALAAEVQRWLRFVGKG